MTQEDLRTQVALANLAGSPVTMVEVEAGFRNRAWYHFRDAFDAFVVPACCGRCPRDTAEVIAKQAFPSGMRAI